MAFEKPSTNGGRCTDREAKFATRFIQVNQISFLTLKQLDPLNKYFSTSTKPAAMLDAGSIFPNLARHNSGTLRCLLGDMWGSPSEFKNKGGNLATITGQIVHTFDTICVCNNLWQHKCIYIYIQLNSHARWQYIYHNTHESGDFNGSGLAIASPSAMGMAQWPMEVPSMTPCVWEIWRRVFRVLKVFSIGIALKTTKW